MLPTNNLMCFIYIGLFTVNVSEERNCELRLSGKLDYEAKPEYQLILRLDTLAGLGNPSRTTTSVSTCFSPVNFMIQLKIKYFLFKIEDTM